MNPGPGGTVARSVGQLKAATPTTSPAPGTLWIEVSNHSALLEDDYERFIDERLDAVIEEIEHLTGGSVFDDLADS